MDQVAIDKKVEHAENIVHTYGELLARLKHVNTALPISLLPASKDEIRQSIQTLIWELNDVTAEAGPARDGALNGLVQAYVYLEQFLPDDKVEVLARGQAAIQSADPEHEDWRYADEANQIVTQIKVAMENALEDMRIYMEPDQR